MTEEAVRNAKPIKYEGVPAKVFRPEYIVAIASSVGRHKDLARIEQLREHVTDIFDDLLADVKPGEAFDVITTFAYPLPLIVICELMGVPVEDRHQFEGWSADATRLLDRDIDEDTFNKGIVATMYFLNYFNACGMAARARRM